MNTNQGSMELFNAADAEERAKAAGAELWRLGEEVVVKGDRYRVHRITKKGIELRPIRGGRVI